jgi:hypothetical protein
MFLGQSIMWQQVWKHLEGDQGGVNGHLGAPSQDLAASLAGTGASLQAQASALGQSLSSIGEESNAAASQLNGYDGFEPPRLAKRPRLSNEKATGSQGSWSSPQPLPDDLVDSLVEVYFQRVHPWIPMLHVHRFRQDLANPAKRPSLSTILHAITSCCLRFCNDPRVGDAEMRKAASKRSREIVILQSM